jgi:hypothetical protein
MAFFYLKEPRKFNYQPRYYDADREMREELISNAKKELGLQDKDTTYRPSIKGKFRNAEKVVSLNFKRKAEKRSNSRILFLIILLCVIFYFIFY